MRVWISLFIVLCASFRASHAANVFDKLGSHTAVLSFTESVSQTISGSGENTTTLDTYSGTFQIQVASDTLGTLNAASIVRIQIGAFLLDTTLGAAPDYVPGGSRATFSIVDNLEAIGVVKAKWGHGKLTMSGLIKAKFIPSPARTFIIPGLEEDARYFISEAADASLVFGDTTGSRKIEVSGKSTFKTVRIGAVDDPIFEDDLWRVSVSGALDFTPPRIRLLSPGVKTNATPQHYVFSTPLDTESITVDTGSEPIVRENADPAVKVPALFWDGLLYLEPGINSAQFTATDRSGNSSVTTVVFNHDWRSGIYSGILDTGTDEMTRTLVLKVAPGGAFTGTLRIGRETFRIKGEFNSSGLVALQIKRSKGRSPLEVQLALVQNDDEFIGEPDPKPTVLSGIITDTVGSYTIDASRAVYDSDDVTPALLAQYYTARIAPDPLLEGSGAPEGTGYLSMKVRNNGTIRALGKVADGSPFSQSGRLGGDGRFLVSARLYAPLDGLVQGFVTFTAAADLQSTCEGTLRWVQPIGAAHASGLFPDGFHAECPVSGGIYLPGSRTFDGEFYEEITPLETTEAALTLLLGEFADTALTRDFDINYKSAVRFVSADPSEKLRLSIKNKTGIFSGGILVAGHTAPAKKFFGIIVGQEGVGEGAFISKTDSGSVTIEAR